MNAIKTVILNLLFAPYSNTKESSMKYFQNNIFSFNFSKVQAIFDF